jgi:hypothetical protein
MQNAVTTLSASQTNMERLVYFHEDQDLGDSLNSLIAVGNLDSSIEFSSLVFVEE